MSDSDRPSVLAVAIAQTRTAVQRAWRPLASGVSSASAAVSHGAADAAGSVDAHVGVARAHWSRAKESPALLLGGAAAVLCLASLPFGRLVAVRNTALGVGAVSLLAYPDATASRLGISFKAPANADDNANARAPQFSKRAASTPASTPAPAASKPTGDGKE